MTTGKQCKHHVLYIQHKSIERTYEYGSMNGERRQCCVFYETYSFGTIVCVCLVFKNQFSWPSCICCYITQNILPLFNGHLLLSSFLLYATYSIFLAHLHISGDHCGSDDDDLVFMKCWIYFCTEHLANGQWTHDVNIMCVKYKWIFLKTMQSNRSRHNTKKQLLNLFVFYFLQSITAKMPEAKIFKLCTILKSKSTYLH